MEGHCRALDTGGRIVVDPSVVRQKWRPFPHMPGESIRGNQGREVGLRRLPEPTQVGFALFVAAVSTAGRKLR